MYPRSVIINGQDKRTVVNPITETEYTLVGNSGLNTLRLRESPSNISPNTLGITSVGHPGSYVYSIVNHQPIAGGEFRVDWNNNRIFIYAFAADDAISISYKGKGTVRLIDDLKLIYLEQKLKVDFVGSPSPGEVLGKRYTGLDKLLNAEPLQYATQTADQFLDITMFEINLDRQATDDILQLRFEAVNGANAIESYYELTDLITKNSGNYFLQSAAAGNYLLRISKSHPYLRILCKDGSALSGVTGVHIQGYCIEIV